MRACVYIFTYIILYVQKFIPYKLLFYITCFVIYELKTRM